LLFAKLQVFFRREKAGIGVAKNAYDFSADLSMVVISKIGGQNDLYLMENPKFQK
jgi:hypothetical protein